MTDITEKISSQDSHIAGMIKDAGKGCIVIANKWDLNEELSLTQDDISNVTMDKLKFLNGSPIIFTSNVTKIGIETIFDKILEVYEEYNFTYKRYLENGLRKKFGLNGVPIKLDIK